MFGIGMQELAIILVVALLVFGPKRLPELARTLGKGLAEFRRASNDLRQSFRLEDESPSLRPARPAEDPRHQRESTARPEQAVDAAPPPAAGGAASPSGSTPPAEPQSPEPAGTAEPAAPDAERDPAGRES